MEEPREQNRGKENGQTRQVKIRGKKSEKRDFAKISISSDYKIRHWIRIRASSFIKDCV